VALLVALELSISGEMWQAWARRNPRIYFYCRALTSHDSAWRNCPNGLKGRCSTTDLCPEMVSTSLHEKKLAHMRGKRCRKG
jgi:hypothetical protein